MNTRQRLKESEKQFRLEEQDYNQGKSVRDIIKHERKLNTQATVLGILFLLFIFALAGAF